MSGSKLILVLFGIFLLWVSPLLAQDAPPPAATEAQTGSDEPLFGLGKFQDEPTYIKADTLNLNAKIREFTYRGNVNVKQGDLRMTSETLTGDYDQNNEVQNLVATTHVLITKGPSIRATSERALYEKESETITLTENPEVQQNGSILTADRVIIYLLEDRSVAEGQVRVKLANNDSDGDEGRSGNPLDRLQ